MAKTISISISDMCPMEIGVNILSRKWKLKILWILSKETIRFNELQRRLGKITTKTLTTQLRELEECEIIEMNVYAEVPPRVEYKLSEIGETLKPIMSELCNWGVMYSKIKKVRV